MMSTKALPRGIVMNGKKFRVTATLNKIRKTGTASTLEDALKLKEALLKEIARELAHNAEDEVTGWTLEEAVKQTQAIVWSGKGGEVSSMKNAVLVMEYFGTDTPIQDITLKKIDGFVIHCINNMGNSGGTVNRKLACLSRIMRTAFERGELSAIPRMPRRREGEHRIRFLTTREEDLLKEVLQGCIPDIHDAVMMLLYTGFRCGELWRLEVRDIDLEQETMTAWKTKNRNPRTIPIVDDIRKIVERRIRKVGGHGRLFPDGSNEWLRRPWATIRHQMGMDEDGQFVPHMLRHTCATRLSQAGVTMPIIKEWMGHTTITTTARYAHFSPKDLHNAAKLLGEKKK